jgi:hypothetical protein
LTTFFIASRKGGEKDKIEIQQWYENRFFEAKRQKEERQCHELHVFSCLQLWFLPEAVATTTAACAIPVPRRAVPARGEASANRLAIWPVSGGTARIVRVPE